MAVQPSVFSLSHVRSKPISREPVKNELKRVNFEMQPYPHPSELTPSSTGPPQTSLPALPDDNEERHVSKHRNIAVQNNSLRSADLPADIPDTSGRKGVFALLDEVVNDTLDEESDFTRHINAIQQEHMETRRTDEDAKAELRRLSRFARDSRRVSQAVLDVYSTLSALPHEVAMEMIQDMLDNPTPRASTILSTIDEQSPISAGLTRSPSTMRSEAKSVIGQRLNKKLAEFEDPETVIDYNNVIIPRFSKTLSGSSLDILANLEEEFAKVGTQLKSLRHGSVETLSSLSTNSKSEDRSSVSTLRQARSDALVPASTHLVPPPRRLGARDDDVVVDITVRSSGEFDLWTVESVVGSGLWSRQSFFEPERKDPPSADLRTGSDAWAAPSLAKSSPETFNTRPTSAIIRGNLWTKPMPVPPVISETGLWALPSQAMTGPNHAQDAFVPVELKRTEQPKWMKEEISEVSHQSTGLWSKSTPKEQRVTSGLWKREPTESISHPSLLPLLPFASTNLFEDFSFVLEAQASVNYSETSNV